MAHKFSEKTLYSLGSTALGASLILSGISNLFNSDNYSMRKQYYTALSPADAPQKLNKELVLDTQWFSQFVILLAVLYISAGAGVLLKTRHTALPAIGVILIYTWFFNNPYFHPESPD